ncbi:MAG: peptidoglycan-binding protein, partial [Clostridia bacterium]|nr:peptidoglycan-binding protein [Clostridia bacterium]
MAYENLCMYCFEDMQGQTTCPHCGRDSRAAVPQIQMLPGSLVYHDRFLIGRALGQDATGIVYAAFDTKRENKLRIREYLPRDCAERLNDGAVVPVAGKEDEFDAGIRKLRASVESVEDPRKRHFFFEENGTAYIAQRKSAAAAHEAAEEVEEAGGGRRRILLFAGIAVAVLLVAAILLITVFNGAVNTTRDITQSPTLDPSQVWIPATTPTATPYVAPTFAALVDPELSWMEYTYEGDVEQEYQQAQRASTTPSPAPTAAPTISTGGSSGYKLINGNSSRADITGLQQKLADLGWLQSSQISGSYDAATRQAVRDFQSYINERYNPREKLSVDGAAGPKTLQWLYEAAAQKPTPTPAPKVTPSADSKTVDESAAADKVRDVQQKLITLGLLPEGSADGAYGATTAAAVRRFQQRVNQLQGYDVLSVTGKVDPQSMAFLNYYAEEWAKLRQATAKPTATPAPTPKPTATPTTRPVETFNGVIDANASADKVREVQQLLIDIGMLPAGAADGKYGSATIAAVADFQQWVNMQRQEQTLPVNGEVDQLTLAYLQYCKDHGMIPYGTPVPQST